MGAFGGDYAVDEVDIGTAWEGLVSKPRAQLELKALGVQPEDDLFFICRSGSRSMAAAKAMAATGYRSCHNVACGFEGPLDDERHRGTVAGWKAAGLPWQQG